MVKYSVIIPTYNRCQFLKTAVDSVLRQTYGDFELMIVDDGSTDDTCSLIDGYKDSRIKYIYKENQGAASARNRALSESAGEYLAFLDSDDRWLPKKLEIVEDTIKKNPRYYIYHTLEKWFRNGKHLNHKKLHEKQRGYILNNCLRLCSVSISTAVIKRNLIDEIGIFDESLAVCEDYDFWLRASVRHPAYLIDRVLTEKEGGHADQLSGMYWGMDRFRIKSICKLIGSGVLDEGQYVLASEELRRKCRIYAEGCFKRGKNEEGSEYLDIMQRCSEVSR